MLRNKRSFIIFIVLVVAMVLPTTVFANKHLYRAKLYTQNELHQVNDSNAHGAAVLQYVPQGVHFLLHIGDLSSDLTGIHLHGPATASENAPVVLTLCGSPAPAVFATCDAVNGDIVLDGLISSSLMAQWGITGQQFRIMLDDGMVYVNAHTELNPAGELRGQLLPLNR